MPDDYDLLIKNASIVDGTGVAPYKGALGVNGERIAAVGKTSEVTGSAATVIDAKGYVVTPGFIDVHNHGDISIMYYPEAEGYLRQGITTFIGGNCGSSPAPCGDLVYGSMFLYDLFQELQPNMYYPHGAIDRELLNKRHRDVYGWEVDWYTMGDFCGKLAEGGISPNYVPILGHGPIRYMAMGRDFERNATSQEIEDMKPHVRQAMEDGCKGISVGRDYPPSHYANTEELIELSKIVSEYDGVYTSHSLRTGLRKARRPGEFPPSKIGGILEAIQVGRKAGVAVQISHLGALYDVYPPGNMMMSEAAGRATLKAVDDAIEEGIDVSFDLIPNIRGYGTTTTLDLVGSLLPWLRIAGSREQFAKALRMNEFREEIKEKIWAGKYYSLNPNINAIWARGKVIGLCKVKEYEGKNIAEIAIEKGIDQLDAMMDIIVEDPYTQVKGRNFTSPVKYMFYQHPVMMVGIDTLAVDTQWKVESPPYFVASENSFGGFAAFFKRVIRENKTLTLEEGVKHVTSLPAKKFKLTDRGVLKPGAYADIVVMDHENVRDMATPYDPCVYPEGIPYVIVNGKVVIEEQKHTKVRPGKVLYRE